MSEIKLVAQRRTAFGKGAARQVRRDHKVPAVLYGHGTDPVHITLPGHETMLALKSANALLAIELEGDTQLALAKDVQRDPIQRIASSRRSTTYAAISRLAVAAGDGALTTWT